LEEAIRLSRHFEVPFQEIGEPGNTSIFQPLQFESYIDLLSYWNSFFEKASLNQPFIIYARSLPLMQMLVSPRLFQFYGSQFEHECATSWETKQLFNDLIEKINCINRKEVWTMRLFSNYQKRIQQSHNMAAIQSYPNSCPSNTWLQEIKTICKTQIQEQDSPSEIRISTKIDESLPFCFLCANPENNILVAELWPNYWIEIRQLDFIKMVTWKVEHLFEMGYESKFCLEDLF
jgi:hypothetical protein